MRISQVALLCLLGLLISTGTARADWKKIQVTNVAPNTNGIVNVATSVKPMWFDLKPGTVGITDPESARQAKLRWLEMLVQSLRVPGGTVWVNFTITGASKEEILGVAEGSAHPV